MVEQRADLGPMTIERVGDEFRLTLNAAPPITTDNPDDFQQSFAVRLTSVIGEQGPVDVYLDLQQIPAISSRQLGLMLSLKKALKGRCERVKVRGVRENVRRLLEITHTLQFFEVG